LARVHAKNLTEEDRVTGWKDPGVLDPGEVMKDLVDPARILELEQGKDHQVPQGQGVETDPEAVVGHSSVVPGLEKDQAVTKESSVEREQEVAADPEAPGQDIPTTIESQGAQ
jgi:hypothetical protein